MMSSANNLGAGVTESIAPMPGPAGGLKPLFDRDTCLADLRADSVYGLGLKRRVERYFATFRLTRTGGQGGFVDSSGQAHQLPPATASVSMLWVNGKPLWTGIAPRRDRSKWLLFKDSDGSATLLLPNYGWDWYQTVWPWAERCGLAHPPAGLGDGPASPWRRMDAQHPGITSAPIAEVGKALAPRRSHFPG